jgi:site-specific DNA recombinase
VKPSAEAALSALISQLLERHRGRLALIPEQGERQAGVYLRLSEDREGDELGIDRQFEDLLDLIKARGWALDRRHVFVDNDLSAAGKRDRPGFRGLVEAVETGQLQVALAWMVDRFLRDRHDQIRLYEAAEVNKMMFAFARGADIDMATPAGQIVADILAAVARGEIKTKGDRQRRDNIQAAQLGKPPSGPVPLGFQLDRVTHDPERARAVVDAYTDLLAGGTLSNIARRWNAAGMLSGKVTTARGREGQPSKWSPESVRQLLLAPRNAGLRAHKGEIIGPAGWDPIVSEETWRAAVALLNDPGRRTQKPTPRHLMSGLALCGGCGYPVVAGRAYVDKKKTKSGDKAPTLYYTYRCSMRDKQAARAKPGGANVVHAARRGDHIDDWIGALVVARLSRRDATELLQPPAAGTDVLALRKERATKNLRLEQIAADHDDDLITRAQFLASTARNRARIAAIDAEIAEAGRIDVLAPLIGVDDVQAVWDSYDTERKRPVVDALMDVVLLPAGKGAKGFNEDTVLVFPAHLRPRR